MAFSNRKSLFRHAKRQKEKDASSTCENSRKAGRPALNDGISKEKRYRLRKRLMLRGNMTDTFVVGETKIGAVPEKLPNEQ